MWKHEQRLVVGRSGLGYPNDLTMVVTKQWRVISFAVCDNSLTTRRLSRPRRVPCAYPS
jgi:hypothetical protein